MGARLDLTGQRFGGLIALRPNGKAEKGERLRWQCVCDCGSLCDASAQALQKGNVRSCGCLRIEIASRQLLESGLIRNRDVIAAASQARTTHGQCNTRTYRAWNSMKQRCLSSTHKDYADYGGRGISVCSAWLSFEEFLSDMGEAPARLTLERKNVDGNYEPGNCVWASNDDQQNNKRNSRHIEYAGEVKTIAQWEKQLGFKRGLIQLRLKRGWSIDRAMSVPDSSKEGVR